MSRQLRSTLLLLLCAFLWGSTFVAQSAGMDYIGPFTYLCCRSVVGFLFLSAALPLFDRARRTDRAQLRAGKRRLLLAGLLCGAALFTASTFQQFGICYTTVGKSGFITAMYILLVPILGLFLKKRVPGMIWVCIALAVVGLWLLCLTDDLSVNFGDLLTLICAAVFSVHILLVDHFSDVDGIRLSRLQFGVTAVLAAIAMLLFEKPQLGDILRCWGPILYAGVLSSGVGYTLQILGQKGAPPTVAAIAMSMESVFSVLSGWIVLHETLTLREGIGCLVMFLAIILAQVPIPSRKKAAA